MTRANEAPEKPRLESVEGTGRSTEYLGEAIAFVRRLPPPLQLIAATVLGLYLADAIGLRAPGAAIATHVFDDPFVLWAVRGLVVGIVVYLLALTGWATITVGAHIRNHRWVRGVGGA